jgi:hypothetical protein
MASPIRATDGPDHDAVTEARLAALAQAEGIPVQEALQMALHVGLELCEQRAAEKGDQLAELAAEIRDVKALVHLVGKAVFGANLLMVHWASKSDGVEVDEDEISNELDRVAAGRWIAETAAIGIPSSLDRER